MMQDIAEKFSLKNFDAIIFDLGGVLLNIDFGLTQKALENLGMKNVPAYFGKYAQAGFFDQLDRGEIGEKQLFSEIRKFLPVHVSDDRIKEAWNAIILDFPPERIQLLKILKNTHRLFLLSNTNSIHYPVYNAMIQQMGEQSLDSLFEKAYYSFREGLRKPETEFFQKVIEENQLNPEKTLFVDDTEMHVEAAQNLGLQAVHLTNSKDVVDLFGEW
jgi:putative hydrolase of the HAD superfamily